ncbi:Nesprin-1 [Bagarius yarrelli]|uniref:Nesprin-1 n=1 Tax=Bagarius yarrelli TaxID=175774 RepID=A0A556V234_BAGYA|nr:Nesprin-1 [Bagarius yarrelli]
MIFQNYEARKMVRFSAKGQTGRTEYEQEAVQKRTFTKWINAHLAKRDPPLVVTDLYEDIKDGVMLLALLEVLSGHKLPCEQGRKLRRIHWLANVGTALHFLEGRRIEELTSTLPPQNVHTSSTSSVDSSNSTEAASPPIKRKPRLSFQAGAKKALLKWVQKTATKRLGLDVRDFGPSWRSGIAFHAVIFALRPQLVDMERVWNQPNRANLEEAFSLAEKELGIPRLLDPEDVDVDKPDEKSIMTYVAQFLKHHPDTAETESVRHEEERKQRSVLRELKVWADQMDRNCAEAQTDAGGLSQQYQVFKHYRVQYETRRREVESCIQSTQKDGMLTSDQALLLDWHMQLDSGLPDPLGSVGVWLHQAEKILHEELVPQQSHEETANAIHQALQLHQVDEKSQWGGKEEKGLKNDVSKEENAGVTMMDVYPQEILHLVETHQQTFQRFHRDGRVGSVSVPDEQLQDMAERLNYVSTSAPIHLSKLEFWEQRHRMLDFLSLGESKLKSWIVKYGRRETTELMLQNYMMFVEGEHFFLKYDSIYEALKRAAALYINADTSVEKRVTRFLRDVADQWRSLAVEVRSVRSMLEEVRGNWEKYSSCVESLQVWLEDAEGALRQPENSKRNHAGMNAAGNFLIETCDETVARDLKHQLLLLNGRWRDLFSKAKQYACVPETQTQSEAELQDIVTVLRDFLETSTAKLTSPVQVSLPDVRAFVRNVQEIKHRLPAMEVRYKTAALTTQLWIRELQQRGREAGPRFHGMTEKCPLVLRECHTVLPVLEELEGQISAFYQIADEAGHIIGQQHDQHRNQELMLQQQSCKRCVCAVESSYLALQRALCCTKTLYNFDASLLQNRVTELQTTAQALMQEALEWRRVGEANGNLTRRFEETRAELEKTLRVGRACLTEKGDPAQLFSKHSDFFSRLDQRVLNAYLKACDDLTDILPEEEQQRLQESVRRLHKQWKDIQSEAPVHLLRLRVKAERRLVMTSLQECRAELEREEKTLATAGSERAIREHRAFFRNKDTFSACQRRLRRLEQLCQKLPENDPIKKSLPEIRHAVSDVKGEVESAYVRLQEHPDKWAEWQCRFAELSAWIASQHRDGESVALQVLEELITDDEVVRRRAQLDEITHTLTSLLSSLDETQDHSRILNAESVSEARQLLLIHQQKLKLQQRRRGGPGEAAGLTEDRPEDCSWMKEEKRLQARAAQRRLQDTRDSLGYTISELGELQARWQRFSSESETLSSWICEKEKELEDVAGITADLQRQIHTVEEMEAGLEKRKDIWSHLEAESRALTQFINPGEAERIRARLMQISRSWEELTDGVMRRGVELQASLGYKVKLTEDVDEVQSVLKVLEEKLDKPVTGCTSTSVTYQTLHEHMEAWQALKLLQPRLVSLSLGSRKISNKDQLQKEVSDLQQAHIDYTNKAARKQAKLEDLLTRWQQYERGFSVLQSWLDTSENLCKSDTPYLTLDKAKLHVQLQTLQDLQSEVPSHESLLEKLETQAEFLYPTASEERVGELTELHCSLEERWCSLSVSIPLRIQELEAHLSQLEQFNQVLTTLTQWSENFLRQLRYKSKVTITDLTAGTQIKDDEAVLQTQSKAMEDLKKLMELLSPSLAPVDLHRLQSRQEDCLQPLSEAESLLQSRSEALVKLETFLVSYRLTTDSLQTLQRAAGQANWDQTKDQKLNQELEQLVQELASMEVQAVSLDCSLNKAYLHLHGADGDRTSCRGLVEDLGSGLQQTQQSLGTKQSEAEALEAMWNSFTRRKEILLTSLTDLEERAKKPWLPEPSKQTFQQRLWMLNQLEEELDALQHSQLWLGEKGEQFAHTDPVMVAEVRRDVTLVQTSWEKIKNFIIVEKKQCEVLVEMCKDYQALKHKLGSAVERAHAVTVTQSVQHNPEDIRRALTRLEAVKSELAGAHANLDLFVCKSKSFINELRNLPEDLADAVRMEMNTVVDQWMDTSERIETEADRLKSALELWSEINSAVNDIECWSATSVNELNDGPVKVLSSANVDDFLCQFKLEIESKKLLMENLQRKVTELQEVTKNQQVDVELQAMAADLMQKIFHAEEVYDQAGSVLRDFSCQRRQLQDVISHMAEQLDTIESTLAELSQSSDPENVARIKQVDGSLDMSGESLRVLCRAYPDQQLTSLSKSITEMVKRSEAVAQRSGKILRALQEALLHKLTQDFHSWLSELRAETEESSEEPGDVPEVPTQLHRLKVSLERIREGEERMTRLHEEEEKLLIHLPELAARRVQERLASCQLALDGFTASCRQRVRHLEESTALQDGLEVCVDELKDWLLQMEERLKKEEVLLEASQPGTLLQEAWTRLHHLQEYQAFGEALRAVEDWLEEVKGRLEVLESTEGNKEEVEERLERVQLRTWLEEVELEVKGPLEPQLGLREKKKQLNRLCLLLADVEDHQGALCYLEESAAELYKRTGDPAFREEETAQLRAQFDDVSAAAEERVRFSEGVVFEHEKYMATVRELTDWLMSKGEELQRCCDPSGDFASVERKLKDVRVRK